jgi:membrane protease YdiL (CAAX protease family)
VQAGTPEESDGATGRGADLAAVTVGLLLPTIIVWLYFFELTDAPTWLQQLAYAAGKTVQFGFPLVAWLMVRRRWPRLLMRPWRSLLGGLVSGGLILAAVLAAYAWTEPATSFQFLGGTIYERIAQFGVTTPGRFALLAVFYAMVHSFLEEYYWRWFVFGRLRSLVGLRPAIVGSGIGFAAHHVIVLSVYFGWGTAASLWSSLAVAVGGLIWAWQYHRTGSLAGVWVSHLMADLAVFAIGYALMKPLMAG